MLKDELKERLILSKITTSDWHWYSYQVQSIIKGRETPFAKSLIDTLYLCENKITGLSEKYIRSIESINSREKNKEDYDQLLQILAELLVVAHILSFPWEEDTVFTHEPTMQGSRKNPELLIKEPSGLNILVEVKAPNYCKNSSIREQFARQMPSRSRMHATVNKGIVLPRDNPVKDFLISANDKFRSFKQNASKYFSVLVIVSDDYIQEIVSPLMSPNSGLLTPNSYAKDKNHNILKYEYVDLVLVTRHLLNLAKCLGGRGPVDCYTSAFHYGDPFKFQPGIGFPPKVAYLNPFHSVKVPTKVERCLQVVYPPGPGDVPLGAEYIPSDLIQWVN